MLYNLARKIRTDKALKEIKPFDNKKFILDIGCGRDLYLLKRLGFPSNGYYFDGEAEEKLPPMNIHFDIITMIAVFEHLDKPKFVLKHCLRLLNLNGKIIITTPTRLGDFLTPLVSWHDAKEHKRVVNYTWLRSIIPPEYYIKHEIFELGLNQLFVIGSYKSVLKATWEDQSDISDFADLPKESMDFLRRTLAVFVDFVIILAKKNKKEFDDEPR